MNKQVHDDITIILLAGGSGARTGFETPKQFLMLNNKPLWYYTAAAFYTLFPKANYILTLPSHYIQEVQTSFFDFFPAVDKTKILFIEGGKTRYHSSKNALQHVSTSSLVFIHDVARCFIKPSLIKHLYESAQCHGIAVPYIHSRDSLRMFNPENKAQALDRSLVIQVQTPQVFRADIIKQGYAQSVYTEQFTDDATVLEAAGVELHWVEGDTSNIKVTFAEDVAWAAWYFENHTM